jgi:hypothetical protein
MRFGRLILALIIAISFASFGIDLDAAKTAAAKAKDHIERVGC